MLSNFINPGVLGWLIPLAALPILIHLLNRRRYRKVPWAAIDFLVQAYKRTHRRLRMENLILLLVRVLICLLATLAISRPFLSSATFLPFAQKKTNLILVVDNSYSMGYRFRYSTAFERAKAAGALILDRLAPERGDTVSLIAMGSQPHVLLQKSLMLKQARDEFDRLEVGFEGTEPARSLEEARRIAHEIKTNQEIYVITDLQRRPWCPDLPGERGASANVARGAETAAAESGRLREILAGLTADGVRVYFVDVGADENHNLGVTDLSTDERIVAAGRPALLRARVTNFGTEEASFRASLVVGGEPKENRALESIPAGESKSVVFGFTFLGPGPADASVQIDADPLPADNQRHLALEVRDRIRVLVIDGDPDPKPLLEKEAGYLLFALDPEFGLEEGTAAGIYQLDQALEYNLGSKRFEDYDLVMLANVRTVPRDKAEELDRYVRAGGGLVAFLGNRVDASQWNEQFHRADGTGLLPGRLGEPVRYASESSSFHLLARQFDHSILKPFESREMRNLIDSCPVKQFLTLEIPPDQPAARVLLRYSDPASSPALVTSTPGAGKVAILTIPATTRQNQSDAEYWSDLPKHPIFLPLVRELTDWISARSPALRNLSLGEPIRKTENRFVQDAWVTTPSGAREKCELRATPGSLASFEVSYAQTQAPGYYRIAIGGAALDGESSATSQDIFAVNVDASEGDMRKATEQEFRKRYPEFRFEYLTQAPRAESSDGQRQEGEIWKFLLFTVLGLLFLESFLAQRFGDYSKR